MKRVSSYLKMRVLGAIESAPGNSIVARIRHVSGQVFLDEDGQRFQFTWRTIQSWYSRYKKDGTTTVLPKPRCWRFSSSSSARARSCTWERRSSPSTAERAQRE
jgi:hypothetical protein